MASNMELGGYTFAANPSECTIIKSDKVIAFQPTYNSIFAFDWGKSYIGKEITMKWDYMSIEQFNDMDYLLEYYGYLAFDPHDDTDLTFSVWIKSFTGDYHLSHTVLENADDYRKNVELVLIIME